MNSTHHFGKAALLSYALPALPLAAAALPVEVRQAQALVMDVLAAEHQHQAWLHHQRMARLARGLVADFAALKRERGWIDMGDLERAALTLMSDPVLSGWVQERLDARVSQLLVDEFQDTDPLQAELLMLLAADEPEGGAAARDAVLDLRIRPGALFIVGDPKQSIYRFRHADVTIFRARAASLQARPVVQPGSAPAARTGTDGSKR